MSDQANQTYDIFISYSSNDLSMAQQLYDRLVAAGFNGDDPKNPRIWFDKKRLDPGCDWHREIEAGCENSRIVIPVLTPRWKTKEWTKYETYGAEAIIPLVFEGTLEEVFTPPLLRFQGDVIDLTGKDTSDRWPVLFEALRKLLAAPLPEVKEQRVAHLRFSHNPNFVGREALMDEIHERLFTNPTTTLTQGHIQAVTALGGVGKTTLAREYAEKFWRCYRQMFWISCKAGVVTEMAGLYPLLFPERTGEGLKEDEKAASVLRELKRLDAPLRLVIFDDAVDENTILSWLPKTGNCHTIITSRFTDWETGIEQTPVWVLDKEPARELLLKRAHLEWENLTGDDKTACDELAGKLGYLPLALEQAAAYIEIQNKGQGQGFGYRKYLTLYEKAENERRLLAKGTKGATEYPDAVFNTWRTTIDQLPPGSRAILRLTSFMAPTPIPFAMVLHGASIVAEQARLSGDDNIPEPDEIELREWKEALIRYSMIRPEALEGFSVHGLVQAVERHQITSSIKDEVIDKSTALLTTFAPYPAFEFENWPAWEVLFPHAEALWSHQNMRPNERLNSKLLVGLYGCLHARARYNEAIPFVRFLLAMNEQQSGPDHPATAQSLNNLAVLLQSKGDYDGAETLFRRALAIKERTMDPTMPLNMPKFNDIIQKSVQ
ncbi:MAG: TIR domain-containing protein [Deltaproteobacteria bacterium]|nr:TIR domain-containing protein [Deltaproteobacteria bacterium]